MRHLALEALSVNSVYLLLCLILETGWYLSPGLKTVLAGSLILNIYYVFRSFSVLLSAFLRHDCEEDENLLLKIGHQYPEVMDKLLNYYQLSGQGNDIADYAVDHFIEDHPETYFSRAYHARPVKRKVRWSLALFTALLIFSIFSYPAFFRFFHPGRSYDPPQRYTLELSPADTSLYSYDSLQFVVKKNAPETFPVEIYLAVDNENPVLVHRSRDSLIVYDAGRVNASCVYYARLRRPHIFYPRKFPDTDTLTVNLLRRPRIRDMEIRVSSPEYSGIPLALYQGNMNKISLLAGSEVSISLRLSDNFGSSWLISGNDSLDLNLNGDRASISWIPESSGRVELKLTDHQGISPESDPEYVLEVQADRFPGLNIMKPDMGEEMILDEALAVPYMATLQDDYGLSSFHVLYNSFSSYGFSQDTARKQVDLPFAADSRVQTRVGIWSVQEFLSPGTEISYYFELSDNDTVSGPKTVRSGVFTATLPTLGDLYDSQNKAQEESMAMLEEELISTEEIVRDLDEVRKELLQEGEMSWENKSELEENLKSLESAREELQKMQTALDEQKQFMEENALFSDDVMQSFEQLQQLMNELIDDEMFNMLKELQDKLDRNDTSNMEELLEDFSEKAKRFEESLDRMLEVFKRIQQEQRLEELGQKIKETLKEQTDLVDNAKDRHEQDLSLQQQKISKDTEDWEELSKESQELFEDEDKDLYNEFLEKMKDLDVQSAMDKAAGEYQRGNKEQGGKQSKMAKEQLSQLSESFASMSSQMMQKQKADVAAGFQRAFHQALFLSNEQELRLAFGKDLKNGSPLIHLYTSGMNDNLTIAMEINDGLLALSKKTFLVDKALGQALGRVIGNLRSGIQQVEEANLQQGQKNFNEAYKSMNELARILLERSNMVKEQQQGNASGLEFYMQQLQGMAGEQQQLNSGMPKPGPDGSPGSSMMDQLAKMAARQQALRKRLKQIQQGISESGGNNRMTGNLDKIAKDMEDVINHMRQNRINRQTITRQQQIVQRLLDASRSATSRDFKKERESKTGKELLRDNPLSLPGDLGDRESLIDMIRREVQNSDLSPQEKRDMERYLESLLGKNAFEVK